MGDIDVPFNFDPVSTTIKTGSFTIPGSSYAKVRVTEFAADFTIDAVIVIAGHSENSSSLTDTTGAKFTNDTDHILIGSASINAGATAVVEVIDPTDSRRQGNIYTGASSIITTALSPVAITLNPGDKINVSTLEVGRTVFWNLAAIETNHQTEFWVKTGTVLVGTRYTVTLYNSIT